MKRKKLAGRHRSALRDTGIRAAVSSLTDTGVRVSLSKVRHCPHSRPPGTMRVRCRGIGGMRVVLYGVDILCEAVLYGTEQCRDDCTKWGD